jgi:2-polyprenyl-6-hydroxyphenyl methylase/3-demethylubiquinone-9 3-methyltransferase
MAHTATIDPADVARFSEISAHWWDEHGPFAPIHRINPARLGYIKSVLCDELDRDEKDLSALKGLKVLDVGCGGGLVCEPLARLGADVTGIDADANAVAVAASHAKRNGLNIQYKVSTAENMKQKSFDVILALEIVEHVADVELFVKSCVDLCKPGGVVIFSTLNKTLKSMALAKIAAEYILRWIPTGTHDWNKFLRPSTLSDVLRRAGTEPFDAKGLIFNPLKNDFFISKSDLDVNYFIAARKGEKS